MSEILPLNASNITSGVIGAGVGAIAGFAVGRATSKRRRKSAKSHSRSKVKSSRKRNRRGRYTPHTAGKRKDTSHRRIRYTKNGQPYIILANGRARFISSRSAKSSHKRKGGKY